jgi:hypothetical protein
LSSCCSACEIGSLTENVHHRAAQNLGNRFGAGERRFGPAGVGKAIAHALPDKVVERHGLSQPDILLPGALTIVHLYVLLGAAEDFILRIEDLDREHTRPGPQVAVGDRQAQDAFRPGGGGTVTNGRLGCRVRFDEQKRRGD